MIFGDPDLKLTVHDVYNAFDMEKTSKIHWKYWNSHVSPTSASCKLIEVLKIPKNLIKVSHNSFTVG